MQILAVKDEPKVGNALRDGLEAEGYMMTLAPTTLWSSLSRSRN